MRTTLIEKMGPGEGIKGKTVIKLKVTRTKASKPGQECRGCGEGEQMEDGALP